MHPPNVSPNVLQISVDLFLLVQSYADVATLSVLPSTTGGSVYHYCPFAPALDQDQLLNDLKWNVSRPQVVWNLIWRGVI